MGGGQAPAIPACPEPAIPLLVACTLSEQQAELRCRKLYNVECKYLLAQGYLVFQAALVSKQWWAIRKTANETDGFRR